MSTRAERLYDITTRHQLYLEGLKETQLGEFAASMVDMESEIKALLLGLSVDTLGDLNRRKLQSLLTALAKLQTGYLRQYVRDLYQFLRAYLDIDTEILSGVIAEESGMELIPVAGGLFAKTNAAPLTANGVIASEFLAAYIGSVTTMTANEVRKALANNQTVAELVAALVGTNALGFKNGLFNRLINQGNTAIRTIMQQFFAAASDEVFKLYTNRYMWNSILDGVTTEICRNRNGKVYIYGQGPTPPAHYNCRSSSVPILLRDQAPALPASFGGWLEGQSPALWRDVLPTGLYNLLRQERMRPRDLQRFERARPLTLDQYRVKRSIILTGQ